MSRAHFLVQPGFQLVLQFCIPRGSAIGLPGLAARRAPGRTRVAGDRTSTNARQRRSATYCRQYLHRRVMFRSRAAPVTVPHATASPRWSSLVIGKARPYRNVTTASLTGCNDSALAVPRIRFFRSEVIARDRLGHNRALDAAFIGERLERGDRHVMAVDLEEAA